MKRITKKEAAVFFTESWNMSWPMILIMFFDFLVSLTDVYVAGRLGKDVQASVGFITQIYFVFIVIANALTVGAVSVISKIYASGKQEQLIEAVSTVIISTLTAGIVLALSGLLLSAPVIGMLGVPAAIKRYGIPLVEIYAIGLPFHYYLINSNGILRSVRRVKLSMATMAAVCCINIGLNFTLVFYTPLGFRGIAIATVASYAAGSLCNYMFIKKLFTRLKSYSSLLLGKILRIGWPAGLLQIAWQIGSAVLFIILGRLPSNNIEVIAAFTNGLRIEAAIFLPAFALNMANAVIAGNLIGENRRRDAFRGGIITAMIGVAFISFLTLIVILNARNLSHFLSGNSLVVQESVRYLYIAMISEPFMAWAVIIGGALNGAGDTRGVMRIVILSQWAVRLPLAYVLGIVFSLGPAAIWWSMNASILVHALLISRRYFRGKWVYHE